MQSMTKHQHQLKCIKSNKIQQAERSLRSTALSLCSYSSPPLFPVFNERAATPRFCLLLVLRSTIHLALARRPPSTRLSSNISAPNFIWRAETAGCTSPIDRQRQTHRVPTRDYTHRLRRALADRLVNGERS